LQHDSSSISDDAPDSPSPWRVLARLRVEAKLRLCGILSIGAALVPPLFLLWRIQSVAPENFDKAALVQQICWTIVASGCALLVAGIISRRILRGLRHSFQRLCGVIESVTAGESTGRIELGSRGDEIGVLASALQRMISAGFEDRQTLMDNNIALVEANESLACANMELEAANDRVREFAEQAGSANAAKRTFLAVMSHEIRTPVNGIIGMTELAMKTPLDPTQRDYLETVNNTAQSLLDLLNEVLDFSKIEAGKLELEVTDFSLRKIVGDAVSGFAARFHSKRLDLVLDIAPEVPDALIGDPYRLRQILVNLLSNAHRFTETGEVAVNVHLDEPGEVETRLRFSVTDTGCGIPQYQQETIFELFTQGDSSTTRRFGGSGLGLTISSQLVHLMDGEIGVLSEVGRGSRFDFTAVLGVGNPLPAPSVAGLPGRRALLLESHPRSAEIIARMLVGWGIVVTTVRCAADGIRLLQTPAQPRFDFIIADTFRAGSNGLDLANFAVSQDPAGTRIVLLTSANQTDAPALTPGASASMICKPVREVKLLGTLLHALDPIAANPERGHSAADTVPHGRKLEVLIVEDNATNRRITRTYLEAWGHTVTAAHDGPEAVRVFAEKKFDLVLMDLQMPRMDGIAATASIRQMEAAGARVPIIALTANVLKGVREECHAAGMCGYLPKPVREHELLAAIEEVVPGLRAASQTVEPPISEIAASVAEGPFDAEALLRSVNHSRRTLDGLIVDSRDGDFPELFANLSEALEEKNLRNIQRAAHAVKGVIGVFHAPAAYSAAKQLEESARGGHAEHIEAQTAELRRTVSDLLSALERFAADSPLLSQAA
jgi:signal transduction histidine kinase/DNA-binding response OmpR family regulator/HPt (histidine-containing phosphotransfer) domain-containing protein